MIEAKTSNRTVLLQGTMSELAQSIFYIKGEPVSYKDQSYMVTAVDDTEYETILLRTSRQVGKTVSQGVKAVLLGAQIPNFQILYVSPSFTQTKEFSKNRIDPFCRDSEFVMSQLMDPSRTWSIAEKQFRNGATIKFRYAFHHADRSRGLTEDFLEVDEAQDLNPDVFPVLEMTLIHSKPPADHPEWKKFYKKKLYTGTPKSLSGTLEFFWRESNQCLWTIKCQACGKHNYLTEKSIGKHGTICSESILQQGRLVQCARPIDPRDGFWHQANSQSNSGILGLHVCQLMAPRVEWGPHGWIRWEEDVLRPFEGRAPGWDNVRFQNEVMGVPCESALRACTLADVMACCDSNWKLLDRPNALCQTRPLYAGVDWGETRSRTVLTIGGKFADGRWAPVFEKVYSPDECDPDFLVADIGKWCTLFNVRAIGCDVGHGFGLNSQLVQDFGMDRIFPIRYMGKGSARLAFATKRKWEWIANRNTALGEYFMDIKRRRIRLPRWEEWKAYHKDQLAVFIEFSGKNKDMMFMHGVKDPDDMVHSHVYCRFAEEIVHGSFAMDDTLT